MVTLMQELHRLDRSIERPTYSNTKIAELQHDGLLSRSEAEVLDIIYAGLDYGQEDDTDLAETNGAEEQWEPSCVAIIHEGTIVPILNLEEIIQRPVTLAEKRVVFKQASNIIYDILLILLEEEGKREK
ncbi:MAG: hypothetical protein ACYDER_02010 [Ktedonobacteraceae bacterium]